MVDSFAQAWIEILPDFSSFRRRATAGAVPAASAAGVASATSFSGAFEKGLARLGIGALAFTAIRSGIDFVSEGIDLAASSSEQINAVQVSYGALGDEILSLARSAPRNLNITQQAFNQLAVRFSSFAKTIAGAGGNVGDVVDHLTQRGADFASVYNIEATEALELFQSGLAGETEPLRRFGIDLSAASVEAYAYASGIATVGEKLTEAQKIQARYGSLLAQTDQVTGDLANTSGSLANQQRQAATAFEQAQTDFGAALLPGATAFVTYANEHLLPKLDEVLQKAGPELATAMEEAGPIIAGAFDFFTNPDNPLDNFVRDMNAWVDSINGEAGWGGDLINGWIEAGMSEAERLGLELPEILASGVHNSAGWDEAETAWHANVEAFILDQTRAAGASRELGINFSKSFAAGLRSPDSIAAIRDASKYAAGSGVDAMMRELGINSPSKVAMYLGEMTGEGYALGVEKSASRVTSALGQMPGLSVASGVSPASDTQVNISVQPKGGIDLTDYIELVVEKKDRVETTVKSMGSRGY